MAFNISERYRLELHWSKINRPKDGVLTLKGAYFSGPVLAQALKLSNNDSIRLDFCKQYSILVNNFYVADLHWGEIEYLNNLIILKDATIKYQIVVDKAAALKDNDYLVIDTANHELMVHRFNMLYTTYIVSEYNDLKNYRNK